MTVAATSGMDFTLPAAPPLVDPPLSLLQLAHVLVDLEGMTATRQLLVEKLASAEQKLETYDRFGIVGDDDQPGEADDLEDIRKALEQQMSEWNTTLASLDDDIKLLQRWEEGFRYLPELGNAESMSVFAPGTSHSAATDANVSPQNTNTKPIGSNQDPFLWYNPFIVVGRDERSTFGWPFTDYQSRLLRAERSLRANEAFQCEFEFWTGVSIPTNYHLSASPESATTSPLRTINAFADPTPTPGTILGTAVGLRQSLASLDQAIADASAGTGMIHATPFVMQAWMSVFPFIRDSDGKVYTVNHNLLVPGYGYPGTGPDRNARTVTDGVTNSTTTLTSASAAFTQFDVGRPVTDATNPDIPAGTVILSVTNATTVVLSQAATGSHSSQHVTIGGTGGKATGSPQQWAYATEMVYDMIGDVIGYPADFREMSPALPVDNAAPVRAERNHALITNRLLRAAVVVDTTTT